MSDFRKRSDRPTVDLILQTVVYADRLCTPFFKIVNRSPLSLLDGRAIEEVRVEPVEASEEGLSCLSVGREGVMVGMGRVLKERVVVADEAYREIGRGDLRVRRFCELQCGKRGKRSWWVLRRLDRARTRRRAHGLFERKQVVDLWRSQSLRDSGQ